MCIRDRGDAYTPEIDTAVSQEIGKGFVARTDFNAKTAKVTELETEVKQLLFSCNIVDVEKQLLLCSNLSGTLILFEKSKAVLI